MEQPRQLTKLQRRVLMYLIHHRDRMGYLPSRREISKRFGWSSPTAAHGHMIALQKKGYLKLGAGEARKFTILNGAGK